MGKKLGSNKLNMKGFRRKNYCFNYEKNLEGEKINYLIECNNTNAVSSKKRGRVLKIRYIKDYSSVCIHAHVQPGE
jgi:hypothetical protein